MKRVFKIALLGVFIVITLGIGNAYLLVPELKFPGEVVVYRGGGDFINYRKLAKTGCAAGSLLASNANFIENTIEAVNDSVKAGASVIHLNVRRTSDDQLVVFHDGTLDCATNAKGAVNETPFEVLEYVDAGFGYTSDDGKTFPYRGKGFKISKLNEFYRRYPDKNFG